MSLATPQNAVLLGNLRAYHCFSDIVAGVCADVLCVAGAYRYFILRKRAVDMIRLALERFGDMSFHHPSAYVFVFYDSLFLRT